MLKQIHILYIYKKLCFSFQESFQFSCITLIDCVTLLNSLHWLQKSHLLQFTDTGLQKVTMLLPNMVLYQNKQPYS